MSGIKGSAIESVIEDLNALVESGRISREEVEARLTAQDLETLADKTLGALWYPLDTWGRMTELLLEVDGGGDPEYLVKRGWKAAERLKSSGVYAQLQGNRATWGDRMGSMLATIGPAMYKDSVWSYERGETESHFRIEARVPAEFPDVGLHPIHGFIQYMANEHSGLSVRVASLRESPTLLVFHGKPA